jgi:hypothetical protein
MKKDLILMLIIVTMIASCKKYEVQYGTDTAATTALQEDVYEIAYSTEEGVFLIKTGLTQPKMLISFANKVYQRAGRVALNQKKDKVAYVDPDSGVPIIVDTAGNVLIELTQYTNVNDLGWHNGDETLYILYNNEIHFHGPALDLPDSLFIQPSGSYNYEVTTIDISKNLNVVYGAIYYKNVGSYRDWYYSYTRKSKSPSLTDQYNTAKYGSYHPFQSVAADSRRSYHTLRFIESGSGDWRELVASAIASGTRFDLRFENDYLLRKSGFELSVDNSGYLFKKTVSNNGNYQARLLDLDTDEEPLYLDWAIGF